MSVFRHDGIAFHYRDEGAGLPYVFQHGLGSDVEQPFELFQPSRTVRLLAFDCRGHGLTESLGPSENLSIPCFADDLLAFFDDRQLPAAVVGGTSMGAAIAMNFALRNPERVLALVLSRPAWLDQKSPSNLRVLEVVSRLLLQNEPDTARTLFLGTDEYAELAAEFPATAELILSLFSRPRPLHAASCFEAIPKSRPCEDIEELSRLRMPVLILVNQSDPIHPIEYGDTLAKHLSASQLVEVTPRTQNNTQHQADVRRSIEAFFESNGLARQSS